MKFVGNFDPKLLKLEDWELFQRMAINNFVFQYGEAKDAFVLIRAHASSLSYDKRGMRNYLLPILEKHFAKSKLSVKNRMYVFFRMIEEYTDLVIGSIAASHYPPRHYYQIYKFLLPFLSLCCCLFISLLKFSDSYENLFSMINHQPEVSIIIVNYNVKELLLKCIASVYCYCKTSFEIILIDNNSTDDTVETVRKHYPQTIIIVNKFNAGFPKANNQGIAISKGDYIFLLNPDTELLSDSITELINYARAS